MSGLADSRWGLNALGRPVVDVEPGKNGYESATTAHGRTLRSGREARVDRGGDGGAAATSRTRSSGITVDTVRRREPDLDCFVAALLALAVAELDAERAQVAE